jgi:hypothetical protein
VSGANHPWVGLRGTCAIQTRANCQYYTGIIVAIGPAYDEFDAGPGNYMAVYMLTDAGAVSEASLYAFTPDDAEEAARRLTGGGK